MRCAPVGCLRRSGSTAVQIGRIGAEESAHQQSGQQTSPPGFVHASVSCGSSSTLFPSLLPASSGQRQTEKGGFGGGYAQAAPWQFLCLQIAPALPCCQALLFVDGGSRFNEKKAC